MTKKLMVITVIAGMASAVAVATPASATSYKTCAYPYVCLYNGTYLRGTKIAQYKDTGYQNLQTSDQNIPDSVVNTRNNDSV